MAEITLKSISHSYVTGAPRYVVRDIELSWRSGGAYALLGPSGCGKTTLLNIMSGLILPSKGRILYDGKDVTDLSTRRRNIAQVFQFPVIYDTMSVFDNLAFPLRSRGVAPREIDRRVRHIAEMLELSGVLAERATRLSADMKQIISLGRGLVRDDVAAILFDEPLTVIDPHRKWMLRRKLREIHRQFQHTLIYVTHDQTEALTFADEVVVMHEGEVLQQGTPEELFFRPAHTYVGYFIGSPGMNFLPCHVSDGSAAVAGQLMPWTRELGGRTGGRQGKLTLGIRPEHIVLVSRASPDASGDESGDAGRGLSVRIEFVEDHGRFRIVTAMLGEHRIKLKAAGAMTPAPGERWRIDLPAERVCLYEDDRIVAESQERQAREGRP